MLPGFNHNVRHHEVLFHVQTEDKGESNPMVVTQLFIEGNVLATRRSSYEKFVGAAGAQEIVLAMMQEQHKNMMKDLIHGKIKAVQDYIQKLSITSESAPPKSATVPPLATLNTLDTPLTDVHDKTLDELILEFLSSNKNKDK